MTPSGAGFQGANYHSRPAGTGANTFTWPASVGTAGLYKVYAKWVGASATNAKYAITDAGGTTNVTVNQAQNVAQWNLLGTFNLDPTAGHKIVLSDNANGTVVADAILFVRVPDATSASETIIDNLTAGTSSTGTWASGTSGFSVHDGSYQLHAAGTGANTFTWPAAVGSAGCYKVYANMTGTGAAPDAKYTVNSAAGATIITVNQQQNQGEWFLLGFFNLDPAAGHNVMLSDNASSGSVIADAIKFVRIAGSRLVQADAIKFVQNNVETSALYVHTDQIGTPQPSAS